MNKRLNFIVACYCFIAITLPLFAGCGDSNSESPTVGNSAVTNASQQTADIIIQFDFPKYKTIEPEAQTFDFYLYNEKHQLCGSRSASRSQFQNGCYTLTGVPVEVKSVICLLRDQYGNPVGLVESLSLDLTPGVTAIISNPDYASAGAELGERLTSLAITSQTPVKLNIGEKTQVKVEGTFVCKNGIELSCDLTGSSRLVFSSSNNSILRNLGGGKFKALYSGSAKIIAALGQKTAEADVLIKAVTKPEQPSASEPDGSDADGGDTGAVKPDTDEDPATAADPEPLPVDTPCSVRLDFSSAELPAGLTVELRGYDANNLLRFRKESSSLKQTFTDVDDSVAKLAGVMLEQDGQVYGIFAADVNLKNQKKICTVSPEIITGEALNAYGELVISTERPFYDLSDETVYENTTGTRSITVKCDAAVHYTIIPGIWAYSSAGAFLEELCSFDADGIEEYEGVFNFLKPGDHAVTVRYRGIIGTFNVKVVDSSVKEEYSLNIDLTSCGLPSGATYEVRGWNSEGSLLFSEQSVSDLNRTFTDIDKNISKVTAVIKTANGEPYGLFEQNISLKNGEPYNISNPTLVAGEQLAKQKVALSFSVPQNSYDLKDSGGFVTIACSPSLIYTYTGNWSESFGREKLGAWSDFGISSSPALAYADLSAKYLLKAVKAGNYSISASYRGLTSSSVSVSITDSTPVPSKLSLSFAADGLPDNASLIYCQLFKDGAAVSDECSRSSASSLTFDDVSSQANGIVIKVKNSSGQLAGLYYTPFSFNSSHEAALNNLRVATGSGMDAYIKSFTAAPTAKLGSIGSYVTGSAQAELTFNSGKILQTRDVSNEVEWSSDDMSKGTANNAYKVTRAGESSLRATLGSKTAELKVYASGDTDDTRYQFGEADLSKKHAIAMICNAGSDKTSVSAIVKGGEPSSSASNLSAAELQPENLSEPQLVLDLPQHIQNEALDMMRQSKSKLTFDQSGSDERTIDYLSPKVGDTVDNLVAIDIDGKIYNFSAEVLIANQGNSHPVSGKTIMLAEKVDGIPVINVEQALEVDALVGKFSPFDKDGMPVLDRVRNIFGCENGYLDGTGGIDGTTKFIIIFLNPETQSAGLSFRGGYFYTGGCMKRGSGNEKSNEGEVLMLNPKPNIYRTFNPVECASTAAHECFHAVYHNQVYWRDGKRDGNGWYSFDDNVINEGFATLSSHICGFNLDARQIGDYKYESGDNFSRANAYYENISSGNIKYFLGDTNFRYGQGYAFSAYLLDRFSTDFFPLYFSNYEKDGYKALAKTAGQMENKEMSFAELFSDFGQAVLLSSYSSGPVPAKYQLKSLKPGSAHQKYHDSSYLYNISTITPTLLTDNYSATITKGWSLSFYETPQMTYSVPSGINSTIFGISSGLNSILKLMLFDSSCNYEGDLN